MTLIVPAVLPSSRKDLEEKLALLARIPSVTRIQIDVVDGLFASPASWPYNAPQELQEMAQKGEMLPHLERISYEIDLMCFDAERTAETWLALGASRLTFHAESNTNLPNVLASSKRHYGHGIISFGCALNIESELALIEQCLGQIEYVQFMGIKRIGRQGQPFDRCVLAKIKSFRAQHPECVVQVDGGVSLENAKELFNLGVSSLIVGSAILNANNPAAIFAKFESLQTPYGV
ncbi:hypothetical protein HY412_00005 [Candidatus Kaiserbacteria bacterium]|nr:hypothetical protein [Candidatus Kaiserbacteria bacterium]